MQRFVDLEALYFGPGKVGLPDRPGVADSFDQLMIARGRPWTIENNQIERLSSGANCVVVSGHGQLGGGGCARRLHCGCLFHCLDIGRHAHEMAAGKSKAMPG
ncbi:MAG TPA: hypothetical protein VG291_01380 [Xanthobacteraceae bacterium]|nr:hypothetical protein [Xanthobacteraceae bacterium]